MRARHASAGFTLLEVLITLIILAIGMLGLANLQSKIHVAEIESYQRAHAVLLLQDMIDRINTNRGDATTYADAEELGTGTAEDCADATLDAVPAANKLARRDRCQWSDGLLGASEQRGGNNVGTLINARGCITEIQPADSTPGVCQPGVYRVTVVWQGLHNTVIPGDDCGAGNYGEEAKRRAISMELSIGVPRCSSP
jgi:type IV pilus assembly protein PilV